MTAAHSTAGQAEMFEIPEASRAPLPGLRYEEAFLDADAEASLLRQFATLPFQNAQYRQYTARRCVVSFGGRYDFSAQRLLAADPIPAWLHPVRNRAAEWAGLSAGQIVQCLVSQYSPGTPLGWHRDVPDFEAIIGISLAGFCRMRFRRYPPIRDSGQHARAELALDLAPRSIYALQGEARWAWQHAVSPTKSLRYSITFRTPRGL